MRTKEEKAKHAAYMREWSANNREKTRASFKKHYDANAESMRARTAKWRSENPEKVKEQAVARMERYRNDPEFRAKVLEWDKQSRGKCIDRLQAYEKMRGQKNKVQLAEYQKQYRKDNREAIRKVALANRHKLQASDPEGYAAMRRAEDQAWRDKNPGKGAAKATAYRATKLQRTAAWANQAAINFFYECCPEDCDVDHILPLQGKTISGLHIETNLQWLTREQNRVKSNKYAS